MSLLSAPIPQIQLVGRGKQAGDSDGDGAGAGDEDGDNPPSSLWISIEVTRPELKQQIRESISRKLISSQ